MAGKGRGSMRHGCDLTWMVSTYHWHGLERMGVLNGSLSWFGKYLALLGSPTLSARIFIRGETSIPDIRRGESAKDQTLLSSHRTPEILLRLSPPI